MNNLRNIGVWLGIALMIDVWILLWYILCIGSGSAEHIPWLDYQLRLILLIRN